MKLLLISLLPTTENFGIKYLHAYLQQHGHQSAILFVPRHDPAIQKSLSEFIEVYQPGLIGCGFMSYEAPFASHLGTLLKADYPHIPFLAGGIHPTVAPDECLDFADVVALGESEETILEMAEQMEEGKDVEGIRNLVFKKKGAMAKNPVRPLIDDLDKIPFPGHFPDRSYVYHQGTIVPMDLKLFRKYTRYDGKAYNIISSRGCPFSCSYCCNSFLSKLYGTKSIRKRSPQNVIKELRAEVTRFPELILVNIHDDCFLAHSSEWHKEFVHDYKKWIDRPFIVRSTPLHLTEEKTVILKEAGLAWVTMGLQSGSERINKDVFHRKVSNNQFLEATRLAKRYGISGYYDVILDNPFEEEKDVIETLKVLQKVPKPFQLQLFTLTFYKGTDIYRMMQEKTGSKEDLTIQNYFNYRPTYLNKLVRISPLITSSMMDYFIEKKSSRIAHLLLAIFHLCIVAIVEPISYFHLMLKGFNYKLWLTFRVSLPTFKTKIRERLLSFSDQ